MSTEKSPRREQRWGGCPRPIARTRRGDASATPFVEWRLSQPQRPSHARRRSIVDQGDCHEDQGQSCNHHRRRARHRQGHRGALCEGRREGRHRRPERTGRQGRRLRPRAERPRDQARHHRTGFDRRDDRRHRSAFRRPRHPGQQRRHLRSRADCRDHPRELPARLCRQCRGPFVHAAGRRQADDQAGPRRQDHQLGLPGRTPRRGVGRRLLLVEGGGHQPHPERRPRPHQVSYQCQRHRSGRRGQRALGPCRLALRQIRAPQAWREEADRRRGGPLRPHGASGRDRRRSRHSLPAKTPTISWRRLTTSTAATG